MLVGELPRFPEKELEGLPRNLLFFNSSPFIQSHEFNSERICWTKRPDFDPFPLPAG